MIKENPIAEETLRMTNLVTGLLNDLNSQSESAIS
jgi:hypothetical protein